MLRNCLPPHVENSGGDTLACMKLMRASEKRTVSVRESINAYREGFHAYQWHRKRLRRAIKQHRNEGRRHVRDLAGLFRHYRKRREFNSI